MGSPAEPSSHQPQTAPPRLTGYGGRHHHLQHLLPVVLIHGLIWKKVQTGGSVGAALLPTLSLTHPGGTWGGTFGEGVVGQSPPARLVLRLHHHHHVEAVAGEILLLRWPSQGGERQGSAGAPWGHPRTERTLLPPPAPGRGREQHGPAARPHTHLHGDGRLLRHGLVHPDEGHVVVQVIDGALEGAEGP